MAGSKKPKALFFNDLINLTPIENVARMHRTSAISHVLPTRHVRCGRIGDIPRSEGASRFDRDRKLGHVLSASIYEFTAFRYVAFSDPFS